MAGKSKPIYVCNECGAESAKWYGRCPQCGAWNSIEEQVRQPVVPTRGPRGGVAATAVQRIGEIRMDSHQRYCTGMKELDRVLGGGIVKGGLMLIGGDPGIGKSTLLLQICAYLGKSLRILYVSGEESEGQLKLRADRLGVAAEQLYVLCENDLDTVLDALEGEKPDILIVDSIQTMNLAAIASASGSVTQVRECTAAIMHAVKRLGMR